MRAVVIDQFGEPEVLQMRDLPAPSPAHGEVLVHVHSAGVNPVDYKTRRGLLAERFPHTWPCIIGWDVAGVIEAVGSGVTDLRPGMAVYSYARTAVIGRGCYAEQVALPAAIVAPAPTSLNLTAAGGLALAGLTAWQALGDEGLAAQPGETILIQCGAGGVGAYAVQIAVARGLRVIATAGPHNQEFVRSLGASECIDYTAGPFEETVARLLPDGLRLAFDTVGPDAAQRTADMLAPGGRFVSIAKTLDPAAYPHLAAVKYVFCEPNRGQLAELAALADSGRLRVPLSEVLPLAEAARAHALLETRHTRGKVVLAVR
ncbi:MAG: NADP-dependent oxidoreductase [Fimbriimonadaceae bacterium]|nr:NADP-dependent oxidoreductase [Fimbriimonadaceae bacterium]